MENVFTTQDKITTTVEFSTLEATSSQVPAISITNGISKLGQHLYILQTMYPHSNSNT